MVSRQYAQKLVATCFEVEKVEYFSSGGFQTGMRLVYCTWWPQKVL